ncbi:MAG: hypothetical protein M1822_005079 [Bathelium mastoideum]|nr:MAG: hypothetical protein M1822_005079 [Bathelium mastoideum]
MDFLRPTGSLLRQRSPLCHRFLAPSTASTCTIPSIFLSLSRSEANPSATSRRCFIQSARSAQQAAAPVPDSPQNSQRNDQSVSTASAPRRDRPIDALFDDVLPLGRSSSSNRVSDFQPQIGSSHMDVESALGTNLSRLGAARQADRRDGVEADRMLLPERKRSRDAAPPRVKLEPVRMRLGPQLGRTIEIDPRKNIDPAKGFRRLAALCARNSIRSDFNKQRFHERPGLKRKRLHSERYRKRFKVAFTATVARVKEMKRKGW